MIFALSPMRFLAAIFVVSTLAALPIQAVVIIQDDFNYTDSNLQGNTPNVVNLAGTTFEGRVSSYDTIFTNGSVARAQGDQDNAIGISTGGFSGSVTRLSLDLVFVSFGNTTGRMGAGFWTSFPVNSNLGGPGGGPTSTFSGFRVGSGVTGGITFFAGGVSQQVVAVDFSALTTNTPYNLSFDINPDGSFTNLVFNGTDYTSLFSVSSVGAFSGTRTNFAGGLINGNQNARGNWDNLIVEAVPEGGSGILLLLGAAGFGLVRRRGNQRAAA